MKKILAVSKDSAVINAVGEAVRAYQKNFTLTVLQNTADVLRYLAYELPEIKILDFTDSSIDQYALRTFIDSDPWLFCYGIIAVTGYRESRGGIEETPESNALIVQTKDEFIQNFPQLLSILNANRHFLVNRLTARFSLQKKSGSFLCASNPFAIAVYADFFAAYLYFVNKISPHTRFKLLTAMNELLMNALEHGNCGVTFDEKTLWLQKGRSILDLIEIKNRDKTAAEKRIEISYSIEKTVTKITIRDDGDGFDWRLWRETPFKPGSHGMGIKMVENMVSRLTYNEKGNEAAFEIPNLMNESNTSPIIFNRLPKLTLNDKDVVFKRNDKSDCFYFIETGGIALYSARRTLESTVSPRDMFLGERDFFAGEPRGATALSIGNTILVKITKEEYLRAVSERPHYAHFFARLFARRADLTSGAVKEK